MARLPEVGSDADEWGDVLNEFLLQSHNADGTLKNEAILASQNLQYTSGGMPNIVTLVSCQQDESPTISNCTLSADTTNYKIGDRGMKITTTGAVTASVIIDPPGPTDPLTMLPASAVGMRVHVPDPSKVSTIVVEAYTDSGLTTAKRYSRSLAQAAMVTGDNIIRWTGSSGLADLSSWNTIYRIRILVVTTAATNVTVQHIWAECPPKAQILFIEDRGYKTFADNGLADLRSLGVPVTWALDPALNGTSVGTKGEVVTDADIATYAAAGDSISFHSWDGSVTSTMTATQIVQDTLKSIRWLQQRGYPGRFVRAAWTQNNAPQAAAARPYLLAYATPNSGNALASWPLIDRWNFGRFSLHGRPSTEVDTMFTKLQQTHGLFICYTHGIHTDGGNDCTPAEWAYFISKITDGVNNGWLEGVTFEELYVRSGGTFHQELSVAQTEYVDEKGALIRRDIL